MPPRKNVFASDGSGISASNSSGASTSCRCVPIPTWRNSKAMLQTLRRIESQSSAWRLPRSRHRRREHADPELRSVGRPLDHAHQSQGSDTLLQNSNCLSRPIHLVSILGRGHSAICLRLGLKQPYRTMRRVTLIANAPQKATRIAPGAIRAPPVQAASAPRQVSTSSDDAGTAIRRLPGGPGPPQSGE